LSLIIKIGKTNLWNTMSAWAITKKSIKKAYHFRDRLCREEGTLTFDN